MAAYGTAAITEALRDVDFPVDKQSLIETVGTQEIEVEKGKMMSMSEIIGSCPHERYESPADVVG